MREISYYHSFITIKQYIHRIFIRRIIAIIKNEAAILIFQDPQVINCHTEQEVQAHSLTLKYRSTSNK